MQEIKIEYFPLKEETNKIIGAGLEVHKHLGFGFLEIVYKDALEHEFKSRGYFYERETCIKLTTKE